MRTFANVKGLSIYNQETGEELGKVEDLCFTRHGKVNGLLMNSHGLFKRDRVIPIDSISAIGTNGVMIKGTGNIRTKRKKDIVLHDNHHGIIGKSLLTSEGEKLGLVEDVYFKEELGTIIGYEVTDGFFADMTEGRKVIKTDSDLTIGGNAVVVRLNDES